MKATRTPIRGVAPARPCVICRQPFQPRFEEQRACAGRCARTWGGRQTQVDRVPFGFSVMVEQQRRARRDRVQATVRQRWQELSVREVEIFKFAYRIAYDQGYNKGFASQRRQQKANAA